MKEPTWLFWAMWWTIVSVFAISITALLVALCVTCLRLCWKAVR